MCFKTPQKVGKWHNGPLIGAELMPEVSTSLSGFAEDGPYYDYTLQRNGVFEKSDGSYLTDRLTDEAIAFVERHQREAFYLQLTYNAPHAPLQAPDKLVEKYKAKGFDRIKATTYAMIEIMDTGVGRILQRLQDLGLEEDTIVMFTSDNGPAFFNPSRQLLPGEPNFNERFNFGMRGSKGWVYEGGIRVPMIVRFRGAVSGSI